MNSKITYQDLELIVESKRNRVTDYEGDLALQKLIEKYFTESLDVFTSVEDKFGIFSTKGLELKPGKQGYIQAVLIYIRNELGAEIIYNIDEDK